MITITRTSHGVTTVRHSGTLAENQPPKRREGLDESKEHRKNKAGRTVYTTREPKFYDHFNW